MKPHRIRCAVIFGLIIFASLASKSTVAQTSTGIIAFRDDCTRLLYAMRWDGSGRIALPFPPLPNPKTDKYLDPWVLDVTTSGPMTVVYYVGISRVEVINGENEFTFLDHGLFAVQMDDVGGVLTPEPPVRLNLPAIGEVDPTFARHGSFSPMAFGDRLALVSSSSSVRLLMTAKVERDPISAKIIGLSDLVEIGDLYALGLPDPKFPDEKGFTGFRIDYSPDGRSIVTPIYYDLWTISLADDYKTFLNSERLTQNTDGFAEWNSSFSPDGSHVAYTSGAISRNGGVSSRDADIYSLELGTRDVVPVTSNSNKGAAERSRNNPIWSQMACG